jgi:pilus assembly protein CpaB
VFVTTDVTGKKQTRLLLGDVQVVAVGQTAQTDAAAPLAKGGGNQASGGAGVLLTLALNQEEAQRMIFADAEGELYLGLLPEGGKGNPEEDGVTGKSLFP